jgi:hypothetical protein
MEVERRGLPTTKRFSAAAVTLALMGSFVPKKDLGGGRRSHSMQAAVLYFVFPEASSQTGGSGTI